jgi:hypothetical protein
VRLVQLGARRPVRLEKQLEKRLVRLMVVRRELRWVRLMGVRL